MQAFSFLHCADLHLGAPFRGLADLPVDLAAWLRDAPLRALDRIVATAIERRVAAVIVAGDLFDAADRNLRAQIELRDRLEKLDAAGIPTLVVAGNHDPLGSAVASIRYPDSVHFFDTTIEAVPLQRDGQLLAYVYGVSYGSSETAANLSAMFPASPRGPFAIGVLHANVGHRPEHGPYAPCTIADLESRAIDYWALGHVHKRETIRDADPVIHYPGNTQGLHMRELGPRGATLVEVSSQGSAEMTPIWTDSVRWQRVRTAIDDLRSLDDLMATFGEISSRTAAEAPNRLHVVLWTLTGSGDLHGTLRRPEIVADLVQSLRDEYAPEPVAGAIWLQRVEVETRPRRDIGELRKQQDLLGDLLRLAEEARQHPPILGPSPVGEHLDLVAEHEVAAAIKTELSALLDEPRLRSMLAVDPWSIVDWPRLLRRAEIIATEGLTDEGTEP